MSSSGWECAPGPCVCGSRRHSEMEYAPCVSSPSALKRALMRPIGYERPAPGGRKIPARFVELSSTLINIPQKIPGRPSLPAGRLRRRLPGCASLPASRLRWKLPGYASLPACGLRWRIPGYASLPACGVPMTRKLIRAMNAGSDGPPVCSLLKECGKSLLYFFSRQVLLTGCDEPNVAERVFQFAIAVAVELILYRLQYFRSGVVSLADHCVRIFDVKVDLHRCPAERLGAAMA